MYMCICIKFVMTTVSIEYVTPESLFRKDDGLLCYSNYDVIVNMKLCIVMLMNVRIMAT